MTRTWAKDMIVLLAIIVFAAMLHATAWPNPYDGFWYETLAGTLTGCMYLLIPAFIVVRLVRLTIGR